MSATMPSVNPFWCVARLTALTSGWWLRFHVVASVLVVGLLSCEPGWASEAGPSKNSVDPSVVRPAVLLALELLEKNPVDITSAVNSARPCCLRKALENSFKGTAEEAARQAEGWPLSEEVWTALLPHIRRQHWVYVRDTARPGLDRFEDLKRQCQAHGYFRSLEVNVQGPLLDGKLMRAGLASAVLLGIFTVWQSLRATKNRRRAGSRRRQDRENERRRAVRLRDSEEFEHVINHEARDRAAPSP